MQSSVALRACAVAGCAILFSASSGISPGAAASSAHAELAVRGRSNATPSIASDRDQVAIAWSASLPSGATDVFVAVSADGGRTFSAPVRVNDVDGDARVNGEQPPRVAFARGGLSVVWTTRGEKGTKLLFAR